MKALNGQRAHLDAPHGPIVTVLYQNDDGAICVRYPDGQRRTVEAHRLTHVPAEALPVSPLDRITNIL